MASIKAICRKDYYPAYRQSGSRPLSAIKWIVIHSTESNANTAAVIARYFKSKSAGGSTHLVVDDNECFRCLPNTAICWGAPGANRNGFHIELCGRAGWSRAQWLEHRRTIDRAAFKTAWHADKWGIPLVLRKAYGLKKGYEGITTHAEVSKAFGGTHWDPGPNFPLDYFLSRVKYHTERL